MVDVGHEEASVPKGAEDVPVEMASRDDAPPDGCGHLLEPPPPSGRADVFQEQEPSPRGERVTEANDAAVQVRHAAQDEAADDGVVGRVGKGFVDGRGSDPDGNRGSHRPGLEAAAHGRVRLDDVDPLDGVGVVGIPGRVVGQVEAGASADFENAAPRSFEQPGAPGRQTGPLGGERQTVVAGGVPRMFARASHGDDRSQR